MTNIIAISGRLGRDAEVRYLPDGTSVTSFAIADDQYMSKDKKKTTWWDCSLFGKRGETLGQYLTKGSNVTVFGEASLDKYLGKDGIERTIGKVRVNNLTLQGGGQQLSNVMPVSPPPSPPVQRAQIPYKGSGVPPLNDDIPFIKINSRIY